jgi:hypothetical protein
MRKVTKRLLVAGFAALVVTACQDSVSVVQPPPPPPPPPPPAVDATVSIQGLRTIPANAPVNPTNAFGDMNVVLNVEEGDNTVTQVDILFDGVASGCQDITTSASPGAGVSASASAADVVECFWDSDGVVGACVGEQLPPAFADGVIEVGAQITLDDGTVRTAANVQTVTLTNGTNGVGNYMIVAPIFDMPAVIGNGRPYWGGPEDRDADGTDDNVNAFGVCPVSFDDGFEIGEVSAWASTDLGPAGADLGAGQGAVETDDASPFVFTLDSGDNDGVEDDPTGDGHEVCTTGQIFDTSGLNVTSQFNHGCVGDDESMYLDYTAPTAAAGAEITVDGNPVAGGELFSEGTYGLTGVMDGGVGFTFGAGSQIDVGDCAEADNADNDATTAFVADFADAAGIDDLPEDDAVADTNELDCYVAELVHLADDVGNEADLETVLGGDAINTGDPATFHGADRTAADISGQQPDSDFILNDVALMFDAVDPDLESGDAGSQVDEAGCDFAIGVAACTNVTAEDEDDETYEVDELGGAGDGTFTVDIADAGGLGSGGPLADGAHTISISVDDLATPANNATYDFTFTLDTTAPVHGALNPAPVGSGGTNASAIVFTIGGTITDANAIEVADLEIYDAVNGVCNDGDDVLLAEGTGADEVDVNLRDLTDGTNSINFNESFTVQETAGGAGTVDYCFLITAEDGALDKTGAANPNQSQLSTIVTVVWN